MAQRRYAGTARRTGARPVRTLDFTGSTLATKPKREGCTRRARAWNVIAYDCPSCPWAEHRFGSFGLYLWLPTTTCGCAAQATRLASVATWVVVSVEQPCGAGQRASERATRQCSLFFSFLFVMDSRGVTDGVWAFRCGQTTGEPLHSCKLAIGAARRVLPTALPIHRAYRPSPRARRKQ